VGGLVGHVLSGGTAVERYLDDEPPSGVTPKPGFVYYADLAGLPDIEQLHAEIRERGSRLAANGPADVRAGFRSLYERLTERLSREPADRLIRPLGGDVFELDGYLENRIVELVVHYDDLAVSCDLEGAPPPDCLAIALDHLAALARYRNDPLVLVRALTRPDRVTGAIPVL
jgi:uncharacterized protein (TIGR03083 family)